MSWLALLALWFALSLPVGIAIGHFVHAGSGR